MFSKQTANNSNATTEHAITFSCDDLAAGDPDKAKIVKSLDTSELMRFVKSSNMFELTGFVKSSNMCKCTRFVKS